ncbi:alpha-2,3-sialyltransferase [Campylobacter jejuni]|uniref:Alpha-2,3-sialyltransferase n=1 Tax=Campylobacter jejuni TaxID=197 RepID=A0A431FX93_CAMJU|nr:alpha-2,3-sialyltransferase [Campylobacter jejuni]RTJ98266.1 alpha-2,3-sialyltransferase [Campylobacter jejuni]
MSKEIQEFIEKLKDWRSNFPIQDYDYTKYNCEIADIFQYADCDVVKTVDYIIALQEKIYKDEKMILHHPFNNEIKLQAIRNFSLCPERKDEEFANYIFLIDCNNKHPMIIVQIHNFFDYIITNQSVIKFKNTFDCDSWVISQIYNIISKSSFAELMFCKNKTFFYFNQYRPLHYFFEMLYSSLILFNKQKKFQYINTGKEFFIPKNFTPISNDKYVLVRPLCVVNFNKDYVLKFAFQESLEDCDVLVKKDKLKQEYDLIIWLGLPGERRSWIEQIEGFANILKHCNKYFKKIKVYIDGMTGWDGKIVDFPENKILFNKIINTTRELFLQEYNKNIIFTFEELQKLVDISTENEEKIIVFKSLAGYDYRTKICYCRDCDIVISDSGTSGFVPFIFYKKPGIIFCGHLSHIDYACNVLVSNRQFQKVTDREMFIQFNKTSYFNFSFHLSYEHIYNLAAEVLEELSAVGKLKVKNLKMHRLDVPPVELIAKQYELEQKLNIKFSIENVALFSELEKKIDTLALNNTAIINNANNTTLLIQNKDQYIHNLEQNIQNLNHQILFKTAKARIQNHLSYKLGQALIINSKSILGYIRMPYVLSYIKDKHRQEQKAYEEKIKDNPNLALPPLETYPDYNEALKEKECFTYKLGEALIKADKEWYKAGYVKFYFKDVPRLKREFGKR